jgi:phosphoglycerate dehydrogenase-like enzyme
LSDKHVTLFLTNRSQRHQQLASQAAPPELSVIMLYHVSRDEIFAWLPQAEFLISERSGVIDANMIQAAPRLRLIQRLGSRVHDIDLAAARAAGIRVCAVPDREAMLVAEHMLTQMLALAKRLPEVSRVALKTYPETGAGIGCKSRRTDENTFAYNWTQRQGITGLAGKTAGIWGFGEIGIELVRRLRGFGLSRVVYHKRAPLPRQVEKELGVSFATLDALLGESDFLCVLLPYSAETDMAISADVLACLKPGTFVVSCGSGSVIDEAALADAIRDGRLGGAALDTFEWEPIRADNPLLPLAREPRYNLLLTPHIAAGTDSEPPDKARARDYDNLRRDLRGQPLRYRVV